MGYVLYFGGKLLRLNYTIATAGHVDHGKTTLIKHLTGKDCDTHPEEKKRGITIHLGFSHINLSDNIVAGIIDVPGHKDFIDTMISGINGIDLVLFIVAADEGFMPQTFEHLQILNVLEIKKGLILITKCDLVDNETLSLLEEDIKTNVKNTFLENATIIPISVKSGINIDNLKPQILKSLIPHTSSFLPPSEFRIPHSAFRLYPDRFFQVKGFGSVITGTVLGGEITKNKPLYTIPKNKEIKIRNIEAYGKSIEHISQGQRASLNLANFNKDDFEKGIMLCEHPYEATAIIDVELSLFSDTQPLAKWSRAEFHTATIETQVSIRLIDKEKLFPNEKCLAQIYLDKPIPVCFGDKFIIRNTSGTASLGGGKIIDAFPVYHRRKTERVKSLLKLRLSNSLTDIISSEIEKDIIPISIETISNRLCIRINDDQIGDLADSYTKYNNWLWLKKEQDKLENKIANYLKVAHKANPLDYSGKSPEEFTALISTNSLSFGEGRGEVKTLILKSVIDNMLTNEVIVKRGKTYALSTHKVMLDKNDYIKINWVDQFILNQKMKVPLWSELKERSEIQGIDEKRLKQILGYLIGRKRIILHDGEYVHKFIVERARTKLLEYLNNHPEGITVAEFRDLINSNRKMCILLLSIFDKEGLTVRNGDTRLLNP